MSVGRKSKPTFIDADGIERQYPTIEDLRKLSAYLFYGPGSEITGGREEGKLSYSLGRIQSWVLATIDHLERSVEHEEAVNAKA